MTSRIGNPDTEADRKLRDCLNQRLPSNFVMVAGAGSGKTTSLVKALDHLAQTRGSELRRRGQQIACITYTDVAVNEIWGDVGNAPLFHVSTIHSFLWTVVHSFQSDLRQWVLARIDEKITDAEAKRANPRTRAHTRERAARDIERYRSQKANVADVNRFTYGTGSEYVKGTLGHDDILRIGPELIDKWPLLRKLISRRFPYVFVDESQDTNPAVVDALRKITETVGEHFCLGFFGDPMQKIYTAGAGAIPPGAGWQVITKPENFRCPTEVLHVINRIRADDDRLEQVRGRTVERDGTVEPVHGTARVFVIKATAHRHKRLEEVRGWLSQANKDPLWERDDDEGDVRVLVLVHRMAARRLGFADIYAALNDHGATSLKNGLQDGTAWVLRPFMSYLLPLAVASCDGADFDVITTLRKNSPLLSKERLLGVNMAQVLLRLQNDVDRLVAMLLGGAEHSIREVLTFVREKELCDLDERFVRVLVETPLDEDDSDPELASVQAFLACPAAQLWGYRTYVQDESPFATQQGIKGAEFQRVLVVLDDEESEYGLFSYGKYFGVEALSETDKKNIRDNADSVVDRTRRLFYVCCSRAVQDLAVLFFVQDVQTALDAVISKGLFAPGRVHTLEEAV